MHHCKVLLTFSLIWLVPCGQGQTPAAEEGGTPPSIAALFRDLPLEPPAVDTLREAIQERQYGPAEAALLRETERNPKSPALFKLLGAILFLDGQYLQSAVALKKSEALVPLDSQTRFTLAMAYVKLGRNDWARTELEKLASSNGRDARYPYWLSRLDYHDMNFAASLEEARQALRADPRFAKAYESIGLSSEAVGNYADAIQAYKSAIELGGNASPWPAMETGALLLKLGRLDEAASHLHRSLDQEPRFPKAHFQMGLLLEKQRKLPEAIGEFKQAAALDASYPEPHYALGRVLRADGNEESAAAEFKKFEELSWQQKSKERLRKLSR
jgi:tetratricopeptide (TPR) repeat protein